MQSILNKLGLANENPGVFCGDWVGSGPVIEKISPIDGKLLARVRTATDTEYEKTITRAQEAFEKWRVTPGPMRGETVRQLGDRLEQAVIGRVGSRRFQATPGPLNAKFVACWVPVP